METAIAIAALVLGLLLVVAGAESLLDGLIGVAERLRLSPFVLTVVLSGFELENIAAGIAANAAALPGAAAGTVLGGVTFLALGVSGLAAVIAPIRAAVPASALVWTALAPVPLILLGLDGLLSRLDGLVLVGWFAVVLACLARSGRALLLEASPERSSRPFARLIGGLAVITLGGTLLGDGLKRVTGDLGVSDTLLGNTAVAASVEAEEVARVAVPARRGRPELALGNVLGTIVHFIALNAGVIALVRPLPLDAATQDLHLPVAAAAPAVLGVVVARGRGLSRRAGAALLGLYLAYLAGAIAVGV